MTESAWLSLVTLVTPGEGDAMNVTTVLGESRFNRFHGGLAALCGLTILFDGYDLTIYGAALPSMIKEFGISPAQAGAIGSWALVGMMLGAIIGGALSDRVGRKPIIVGSVLLYSVFTGAVFWADTPNEVALLRFAAGLGIGGVMPNAVALVADYAPAKHRHTLVSSMFSGYMVGGILASLVAIVAIPAFGWRSIYLIGAIPLVLVLPALVRYLPESPSYLLRTGRTADLSAAVRRANPSVQIDPGTAFQADVQRQERATLRQLFADGFAAPTALLWVAFFMVLLMIYGLLTWLPQLMVKSGYALGSSLSFLLTLFIAATIVSCVGGYLADRLGSRRVLVVAYLLAAALITLLGHLGGAPLILVYAVIAVGGGAAFSAQIFANAFAAELYPPVLRTAGLGWALGVGRVGAIVGPLLGGILLDAAVPLSANFLVFAIPGVLAATSVLLIRTNSFRAVHADERSPARPVRG